MGNPIHLRWLRKKWQNIQRFNMSQKEQNAKLVSLKQEFQSLMNELESVVIESAEILGAKNENTLDWVQSYLNGECSLKTMRAEIKHRTVEQLLHKE